MFLCYLETILIFWFTCVYSQETNADIDVRSISDLVAKEYDRIYQEKLGRMQIPENDLYLNNNNKGLGAKLTLGLKTVVDKVKSLFIKKPIQPILPSSSIRRLVEKSLERKEQSKPPVTGWVPGSWGTFPEAAVVAGYEGKRRIFVARSVDYGRLPGMLVEGEFCVKIELSGETRSFVKYEVLSGHIYIWYKNPYAGFKVHSDVEDAGYVDWHSIGYKEWQKGGGQNVCRTWYKNHLYVGRTFEYKNDACLFGNQDMVGKTDTHKNTKFDLLIHAI